MWSRQSIFESLTDDLAFDPKRAVVYLGFGFAALCVWVFARPEAKLTLTPLVFGTGSVGLLLKGTFLFRRTSDGLTSRAALSLAADEAISDSSRSKPKAFPPIPSLLAQLIQDFGAGGLLIGSLLHIGGALDNSWKAVPSFPVFLAGAVAFLTGWVLRRIYNHALSL
jgi:hypothetical protein